MTKRTRRTSLCLLATAALVFVSACASRGPEPLEIRDARLALQDARSAGAEQLAPELLNTAQAHLSTAQSVWRDRGDTAATVHYARLADSEARDAQFRAREKRARRDRDAAVARTAELEISVRDAELRAQTARARSDSERLRTEADVRLRQERERSEAALRLREERERSEAAASARESAQREADERVRALEASLEAERRKSAEQQQQTQIDALKTQLENERRASEETRRSAEAEVAAARKAADDERSRAQQIERATADRERAQNDLFIRLQKVETTTRVESRGIVLTLPGNVFFDSSQSDVKPGMRERLGEIGKALATAPDRRILVEGHTDSTGKMDFNMRLSELRAEAVKAVLVTNGVSPDRIEIHGYGPTKPIASNAAPNGRSQNRRVEVVVHGAVVAQ